MNETTTTRSNIKCTIGSSNSEPVSFAIVYYVTSLNEAASQRSLLYSGTSQAAPNTTVIWRVRFLGFPLISSGRSVSTLWFTELPWKQPECAALALLAGWMRFTSVTPALESKDVFKFRVRMCTRTGAGSVGYGSRPKRTLLEEAKTKQNKIKQKKNRNSDRAKSIEWVSAEY